MKIRKFIIGVRTANRMFRVQALGSKCIDSIMNYVLHNNAVSSDYFTHISSSSEQIKFSLRNTELGNILVIDDSNIVFYKDFYDFDDDIDIDTTVNEFLIFWNIINEVLEIKDIRRIGIVAEQREYLEDGQPSKILLDNINNFDTASTFPAKYQFTYESRHPTKESIAPDIAKDDFINVIYHLYDGILDRDHSEENTINVNIDVQRYYHPNIKAITRNEVMNVIKIFNKELEKLNKSTNALGNV